MTVVHLVRRFFGSLSRAEPVTADVRWAHSFLLPGEVALWNRMSVQDRRHSIVVAKRFAGRMPDAIRDHIAGALLHDVGKVECGLGTTMRVVATVVGPRTERFRRYHQHELIGLRLAEDAGSSSATLELLRWQGPAADVLRVADHV